MRISYYRNHIRPCTSFERSLWTTGLVLFAAGCAPQAEISPRVSGLPRLVARQLPSVPVGVGGGMSGYVGETLVLAGGSYFPVPPPAPKVWVDRVLSLPAGAAAWREAGRLPQPLAYAAAVTTPEGIVLAGGCDSQKHYDTCSLLTLKDGAVAMRALPSLPKAVAYASGTLLGKSVYVAGGRPDPTTAVAMHTFWRLDLDQVEAGWQEAEPWPGPARMLPIVADQDGAVFVISGADLIPGPQNPPLRRHLTDAYRYDPGKGWRRIADSPQPVVAGSGVGYGKQHVLVFGGDDGHLFEKGTTLGDAHPGFSRTLYAYDTRADTWTAAQTFAEIPVTTMASRHGADIVIPSGEDRPGHRTANVWIFSPENGSASHSRRDNTSVRIVALGDSTTFGYGMKDPYPMKLERALREAGVPATVINAGVNGDTSTGARQRFDRDVLAHHPDLVIIQFGLNDQTMRLYQKPETITPYVTPEQFEDNHRYFIRTLRERGARVILMTSNPMCWTPKLEQHYPEGPYLDPPNGGNALLERYMEVLRKVAREERVPLVDVYAKYREWERTSGKPLTELILGDGVHPNEAAYVMEVEWLRPVVMKAVRSRRTHQRTSESQR